MSYSITETSYSEKNNKKFLFLLNDFDFEKHMGNKS